tara:strand:- start:110 stop:652 length:543 start_codon:yes stop_codon:yes gene_type:complete
MKHYKVDIKQYVTFDQKTGQILSIGPSYNEGACYIEVSDKEVEPIKSLQEKMTDYIVAYNRKNKVFKLKKVTVLDEYSQYQKVPKISKKIDYDILLNIDKKAKMCYINTSDELLDIMEKTNIDLNKKITFSFTKKDDPHVLYDMVIFDLMDKTKKTIDIKNSYDIYTTVDIGSCVYGEIT